MNNKVQQLYEEWCGTDRHINDCHPVHDSTETIEFAEYYYKEMIQKPKTKTIKQRKEVFNYKLHLLNSDLPHNIISEFFEYWTEHGDNDRKMRFEKQTSFDINKRLQRWSKGTKKETSTKSVNDLWKRLAT